VVVVALLASGCTMRRQVVYPTSVPANTGVGAERIVVAPLDVEHEGVAKFAWNDEARRQASHELQRRLAQRLGEALAGRGCRLVVEPRLREKVSNNGLLVAAILGSLAAGTAAGYAAYAVTPPQRNAVTGAEDSTPRITAAVSTGALGMALSNFGFMALKVRDTRHEASARVTLTGGEGTLLEDEVRVQDSGSMNGYNELRKLDAATGRSMDRLAAAVAERVAATLSSP
jgi:hypothetical protein